MLVEKVERSENGSKFDRVPKFITRLYKVTSEEKYRGICWTADGLKIHIHNREIFVKETLPLISKTKEFGTFVRMLNSYGFFKWRDIESEDIYHNKNFRKGREDLLRISGYMKSKHGKIGDGQMREMIEYLCAQNKELYTELAGCRERIDRQERCLNGIAELLSRVFRTNVQNFENFWKQSSNGYNNHHNEIDLFLNDNTSESERSDIYNSLKSRSDVRDVPKLFLDMNKSGYKVQDSEENEYQSLF